MLAGGHQVVPGSLGGGGGEDGGGDLQKALCLHGGAQGGHHVAAQNDVLFDLRVAQVKIAVLQTLSLVRLPAAVDLEGELAVGAAAQHLHGGGDDLNVAGGQLGVLAVPLPHGAGHGDGGLLGDALKGVHQLLGLGHHLGGAVEVAHHHEGQAGGHHADILHPADDGHLLPHMLHAQLAAGMSSGLKHDKVNSDQYNLG